MPERSERNGYNYDLLKYTLDPKTGEIRLRFPCPHYGLTEKHLWKTQIDEMTDESISLSSYCPIHGEYSIKIDKNSTDNAVVDTLLSMKYHELMRIMPEVKLYADKLLFPENLMIQSYDLGVIIGNALDNAIEACKKVKGCGIVPFIRISSFMKGRMLFIKVENSFDGKVLRENIMVRWIGRWKTGYLP